MSKEKMVRIFIERTPGDSDPNMVVGVNGKLWLLPKGRESEVPESVAYEYNRSLKAQRYSAEHAMRIIDENRLKEQQSEASAAK